MSASLPIPLAGPAPSIWPGERPPTTYERRRPEEGTLHRVVRENLRTLYAAAEEGFAGAPLPGFVRAELEGYVDCGLLQRGFALIACRDCPERRLVAFSCKSRSFCPSCLGRRMVATTLNLLEHVVPPVGLRQFVLTVPHALRARLAYDGPLLGAVCRIFVDSVLGWYRRRMEIEGAVGPLSCWGFASLGNVRRFSRSSFGTRRGRLRAWAFPRSGVVPPPRNSHRQSMAKSSKYRVPVQAEFT